MGEARVVLDGLVFGESVRWHAGRVWFCDWGAGQVVRVVDGRAEVVARVDDFPFCVDWLPDGRMLTITGRGVLLRDGTPFAALESPYPWNDIAVDRHGNAFVNNIGYAFGVGEPAPGTISVVTPDGASREVAAGLEFPNGMAVLGDTLIVAESHASRLSAFTIAADGTLSSRRIWATVDESAPDGIFPDPSGAIWYADVPNKECTLVREGGEVIRRIPFDRGAFDCALAGNTLYAVIAHYPSDSPSGRLVAVDL
ncbi:SMP-30/gluconolactonase/LRE family protein [Winogradskya humida]|uniref:Gluconolaconase n=1 Tax=Winogradskya humida TaxID=113566 RepID=A0ABQ4A5Z4_9ACTN|nr:SMP-30/gluconolactonase/LRE family protein [Actinoplanes humidus]GIE26284.1 gluconolaconase [Actinoplanes humidus]